MEINRLSGTSMGGFSRFSAFKYRRIFWICRWDSSEFL